MKYFTKKKKSPITPTITTDLDLETMLKRKQDYLESKEKELLEMQKKLQKKMNQFKKKRHNKAKADLKAAKKLNRARKKLMLAVDVNEKVNKQGKKKKICTKCDPTQRNWVDKIHELLERFLNCDRCSCFCKKKSVISKICEQYFKKIVAPCPCEESIGDYCESRNDTYNDPPCKPRRYSYLDAANDHCYEFAMGRMPPRCGYPPCPAFNPGYTDFRTQFRSLKFCLLCLASFLFWSPCLLFLILCKCLCCVCNSDC